MANSANSKDVIEFVKDAEDERKANEELSEEFGTHVSERVKLYEAGMKGSASLAHLRNNKNNNIRHVVPVGVLIVLFTLYLTTATLQCNYVNREQEGLRCKDDDTILQSQELQALEAAKRVRILEKLLEYKDLCTELEVFTKDLRWTNEIYDKLDSLKEFENEWEQSAKGFLDMNSGSGTDGEEEQGNSNIEEIGVEPEDSQLAEEDNKSVRRNGQNWPHGAVALKKKKVKSENNKNNHSIGNNPNSKKDQPIAKKTNTAEPIIYLFALVFIYLLLKAASDINQHYKSQNKGGKRLRRCSLQSYAQTHKQDRRASKGSPKKKSNRELILEMRSKSVDRFNDNAAKKSEILANLRKYTSFDDHNRLENIEYGAFRFPHLTTWEAQSRGAISFNRKETMYPKVSNRRCSVPISLNFQRQKLSTMTLVPASSMARRTSFSGVHFGTEAFLGGLQFADRGQDSPFLEVKRRVRMINRH
ncbi:uncharacterized protein LOC129243897 [Anastrepha obliqua]|uniref:uncharacterized protein LOC129243897 n=1 Tax=Anastrepha obliqua TaxID=95512 RepID=UPI0024091699|nr:uncharacterized protein LOC129243897 [Anastrepha obliqua]XP_054737299.1 uncharacterized protein LOC129243897 [Anastrepha obliqua]XP_054737300.1 uncharacterized protein LOC129243897 [Anastrepha obliqua]